MLGELLGVVGVDLQHLDDAVVHEQHAASAVRNPLDLDVRVATGELRGHGARTSFGTSNETKNPTPVSSTCRIFA